MSPELQAIHDQIVILTELVRYLLDALIGFYAIFVVAVVHYFVGRRS